MANVHNGVIWFSLSSPCQSHGDRRTSKSYAVYCLMSIQQLDLWLHSLPPIIPLQQIFADFIFHYFLCLNLEDGRGLSAGSNRQRQRLLFSAVSHWFYLMNTHVSPAQNPAWGQMHTQRYIGRNRARDDSIKCPFIYNQTNSTAETHWAFISM